MGIEPFGEERYVQAAEALLVQGRRATARQVVNRGLTVACELGLLPGSALAGLAEKLA